MVGFVSFLILLVISLIVSVILYFGLDYNVRTGWDSFTSQVILGYVGAWIGTDVLG